MYQLNYLLANQLRLYQFAIRLFTKVNSYSQYCLDIDYHVTLWLTYLDDRMSYNLEEQCGECVLPDCQENF